VTSLAKRAVATVAATAAVTATATTGETGPAHLAAGRLQMSPRAGRRQHNGRLARQWPAPGQWQYGAVVGVAKPE
jgi:hypothetical protein